VPFSPPVSPLFVVSVKTASFTPAERGLSGPLTSSFLIKAAQNGLFSPQKEPLFLLFLTLSAGFNESNGPEPRVLKETESDVSARFCSFSRF